MPEKHPKRPRDLNQWAKRMVDLATGSAKEPEPTDDAKDPLAVELGRRGGLKGGRARAKKLSAKDRAAIARLHPVQGLCAEAGGAATLFLATFLGIPVSTTHTITGAIVGVGAARKVAALRWNVASNVVTAWILTMPAAALMGAAFYQVCKVWA